jgi:hypothetical protein
VFSDEVSSMTDLYAISRLKMNQMTFSCVSLMYSEMHCEASLLTGRSHSNFHQFMQYVIPSIQRNIVNVLDTRKQIHNSTAAEVANGSQGATHQRLLKEEDQEIEVDRSIGDEHTDEEVSSGLLYRLC